MYEYAATVLSVIDGDTVSLAVDLGFGIVRHDHFRLFGPDPNGTMGLNAPETSTVEGKEAKAFLAGLLGRYAGRVTVRTVKDRQEKFGRYLGVLLVEERDGTTLNVNAELVRTGHAQLRKY